jgi:serine/threonine protein kinase
VLVTRYFNFQKLKAETADSEKVDLIKEAIALSSFNHTNLIKFYGICMQDETSPKYLLLEFMKLGDLLSYLRSIRKLAVSYFALPFI